jgi:rhamnogalacturonan acetylesterase
MSGREVVGQIPAAGEPNVPTLFVVGDSTASNGPDLGWGSHLGKYFDPSKIRVVNRARGGHGHRLLADPEEQLGRRQGRPGFAELRQMGGRSRSGRRRSLHRPQRADRPVS